MGAFGGLIQTNRGRILQSKAQAGVQLKYTRIAIGDGSLGTTSILSLNRLIHEVKSLNINKLKVLDQGRAIVGAVLTNQNLSSGFYYRELGVFAEDPDVGEILYCYGNSGDLAEYIPASGIDIIEKNIDIQTLIGNASNVTAVIDDSLVFASVTELQNLKQEVYMQINELKHDLDEKLTFTSDGILYRWGFSLSPEGAPQIWYEEVVE